MAARLAAGGGAAPPPAPAPAAAAAPAAGADALAAGGSAPDAGGGASKRLRLGGGADAAAPPASPSGARFSTMAPAAAAAGDGGGAADGARPRARSIDRAGCARRERDEAGQTKNKEQGLLSRCAALRATSPELRVRRRPERPFCGCRAGGAALRAALRAAFAFYPALSSLPAPSSASCRHNPNWQTAARGALQAARPCRAGALSKREQRERRQQHPSFRLTWRRGTRPPPPPRSAPRIAACAAAPGTAGARRRR